jgi:ABC-type Fe3+/spermidine/putrescine transport system ATPase subunit
MTESDAAGDNFLCISSVTKVYDGTRIGRMVAVEPVDSVIKRGEFVSIIGPSGC